MVFKQCKLTALLWFTIYLGCLYTTSAQSNIEITHRTTDYGKNFRWVYDITQDDDGFIWLANHTGLRRYDGENFITWQHSDNDSATLSTNTIIRVSKDQQGNIWAYGNDGVFNKLELASGKITRVQHSFDEGNLNAEMKHFGPLSNDDFIALYHQSGTNTIWRYNPAKNKFENILNIPVAGTTLEYFTERSDGKLWLWGMGAGYYLADISNNTIEYFPVNAKGYAIPVDKDRKFWYPSNNVDPLNEALLNFSLPDDIDVSKIERVQLDNAGNIWFYHGEADVYQYDVNSRTLERFVDPMFKRSNGVQLMYHFFEDQDGGFWNGHFFGAVRFKKRQKLFNTYFNQVSQSESISAFSAREIIEFSPDVLLVKENEQDLYTVNLVTSETTKIKRQYRTSSGENISKWFYSMVLSRDGYLWTNQSDKLIKTNIVTGAEEVYAIPVSPLAENFTENAFQKYWPRIFEDASGKLWWCGPGDISIFDRKNKKMIPADLRPGPAAVHADFKFARYDPVHDAIYGSYDQGIYLIDCSRQEVSLLEVYSIQEGYDIMITSVLNWNDEFWLSTNKGLIRYNPQTGDRQFYTRKDGLPSNVVYNVLGSKDHLWLATRDGLCQLDPYENVMVNYYQEQGLASDEFNLWSCHKTSSGRLFFGGPNGIVGFNPENFKMTTGKKGQLNLVGISKYNQKEDALINIPNLPYTIADKIIFNANERTITFRYTHTIYGDEFSSNYSHILEGLDNQWIDDGFRNEARYLEIPPGDYIFRAKAVGPNNISALNEIAIPISIKQYWYLRWWAVLIYIFIAASAIYFIYRMLLKRNLEKEEALRMKELDEVKTKMYTNITHEFRTPLTVMLGMNDAAKEYAQEGETDKVLHAVEMIGRNGKNLLNLINQMLELSKLEAGVLSVNNQQGNIVDYLKYRMESFQSYGEAKQVQIHFDPEEEEIIMDFDVDKISYIIGNLVSNAIKFTPGSGNVYVQVRKTFADQGQPFLELKVRDTGIGIEADKINRIFDRFYQVDDSNIRKGEGTGIGLSLVKQLVKLLKGNIQVESRINEGSEFTVLLPITQDAQIAEMIPLENARDEWSESISNFIETEMNSAHEDMDKPLVLIVEDNADVAHYIGASIKEGYQTIRATNGVEGIEKAIELIPDIIISDIMMPEKDGFELCETLKKDERTSHIPIILLTGKADGDSKIQGLEHGADVYLSKPFNRKELLIRLKNLLALRAEIQKHYSESDFSKPVSGLSGTENAFLLKIRNVILENIEHEDFNITKLCDLVHLSRPQLHRKLVAITGESTSNLIRKVQLEKARELLASGEFNVSEVAYQTGFKTQAHFSRVFSEALGVPPSSYVKK